jgi:hypothetical protein
MSRPCPAHSAHSHVAGRAMSLPAPTPQSAATWLSGAYRGIDGPRSPFTGHSATEQATPSTGHSATPRPRYGHAPLTGAQRANRWRSVPHSAAWPWLGASTRHAATAGHSAKPIGVIRLSRPCPPPPRQGTAPQRGHSQRHGVIPLGTHGHVNRISISPVAVASGRPGVGCQGQDGK